VLAWEFIDGVPVASITASAKASPSEFANDPSQPNQDFERIARQIYRNALNQIFRDGIFHADISAAGLLVVPSGSIAHVDFAVVGRLDEERQTLLQSQHENLLSGQVDESVDILIECAGLTSSFNHGELRRALAMVLEDRLDGFQSPSASLPREVAQNTYARLMSTFCEHGIVLPADLSLYFRTMMTMESLIFELSPDFDAVAEQSRFFSLAAREDYRQSLELSYAIENVARLYQDAVELVSDLRRLHNSAQAIDMSLRTLRTRLLQYCFWGVLVAVATYFGLRDEHLRQVMALKPFLLPGAFLGVAVFLFNRLWRQSRQLSRVDRAIVSTREIASRSLGRVR
jgi:predicted unusual protein kinase regulating ubiquinone biosynthesis (AarF/ABC1/UbiB family)